MFVPFWQKEELKPGQSGHHQIQAGFLLLLKRSRVNWPSGKHEAPHLGSPAMDCESEIIFR